MLELRNTAVNVDVMFIHANVHMQAKSKGNNEKADPGWVLPMACMTGVSGV